MDNWQLQHSRSLAFDEQRHQDIASIGKLDRVVMAVRHICSTTANLATRKQAGLVQIHPWSYLTSCSKANPTC